MQVLCVASQEAEASIACPVCGQQYEVFYSRGSAPECEAALAMIKKALVEHHHFERGQNAHPAHAFNLPPWHGNPFLSAAALLSGARPRPTSMETVQVTLSEITARAR